MPKLDTADIALLTSLTEADWKAMRDTYNAFDASVRGDHPDFTDLPLELIVELSWNYMDALGRR